MEASIFLARIFGLYLLIVGILYLVRQKELKKAITDFFQSSALLLYSGAINLILGLLVILFHNVWVWGWPIIITILGYLTLLKGIMSLFFPQVHRKFAKKVYKGPGFLFMALLTLILSLLLIYEGFF